LRKVVGLEDFWVASGAAALGAYGELFAAEVCKIFFGAEVLRSEVPGRFGLGIKLSCGESTPSGGEGPNQPFNFNYLPARCCPVCAHRDTAKTLSWQQN
jgi:hypothetical protein